MLHLIVKMDPSDIDDVPETVERNIDWGCILRILLYFPKEIMKKVAYCMFIGSLHIGRKVGPKSTVCD